MEKCESWQVLVEHCLFDAPWWLESWANSVWLREVPLIFSGLVLMAVFACFLYLSLILNKESYLRIGNLRENSQNIHWSLAYWLDYRSWVLGLSGGMFLILCISNYWANSPANIIAIMGGRSFWHLSPTGVVILTNIVGAICISNGIMTLISLFSLGLLFIDPKLADDSDSEVINISSSTVGGKNNPKIPVSSNSKVVNVSASKVVRYSLRLQYKGSRPFLPIKLDNTSWPVNEIRFFSTKYIYVNNDGTEFSLSQKNGPDWMALYFDDHNTTLSGWGERYQDPSLGEIILFKVRAQSEEIVQNNEPFSIGLDPNFRSIFYFESNHI